MNPYINQYKLLFYSTWVLCYIIFPAWALPVSVTARAFIFFGLIIYFFVSALIMDRLFCSLTIDKPVISNTLNVNKQIKDNVWFFIICCIATILHIYPIGLPILIIGDETIHLQGGLWIYEYINSNRHFIFQIAFWVLIILLMLLGKKYSTFKLILNKLSSHFAGSRKINLLKCSSMFLLIGFLVAYFLMLRNIHYFPGLIRYPPVSKLLYLISYSAFGINHIFPRIIQLGFYLLCGLYLYRTINLFYEKETALLGASIYLFLPVTFAYAYLGEIESGVIFFVGAISFYFLRFIKDGDNRDLLLTTYLLGVGFLYKDPILLMFVICFIFLIVYKIKRPHLHSLIHLKVLSLALLSIIPWMMISKIFNWRNYTFLSSNFVSLDGKLVDYLFLTASNLSGFIFILFVISVLYICIYRRDTLTVFFGFLFVAYYLAIVSDMAALSPRLSMTYYPTIAVFLSLFISRAVQNIKWRHALKLSTVLLTAYLIIITSALPVNKHFLTVINKKIDYVPRDKTMKWIEYNSDDGDESPLNKRFLTIENMKLHYFPSDKAMKWVKANVKEEEKVLTMRILSSEFYRYKYVIDSNNVIEMPYSIEEVSTPDKLVSFYKKHAISYIMFPYSRSYIEDNVRVGIFEYLKNNPNKEFVEIAKYNLGDNYIYLYKLRDT